MNWGVFAASVWFLFAVAVNFWTIGQIPVYLMKVNAYDNKQPVYPHLC